MFVMLTSWHSSQGDINGNMITALTKLCTTYTQTSSCV